MRELTADTIIRVRKPLPLPRKRELTGDTRIRLSQIVDLKDWALEMAQDEAAPEGTVHHWSDGDHVKKNGKWVPVQQGKESRMATTGRPEKKSLTQSFFDKHYNGKVPKTKKEINQFIKDSGAEKYDPKSRTPINRFTKRGMEVMKAITGGDFKTVLFIKNPEVIDSGTAAQVVRGMPGVLMINPENEYWKDPEARNDFVENYTSTKNIYHVFLHEDAHTKIKANKQEWDKGDRKRAGATSKLAKISPDEFCSEFYAKKKYLDKYPDFGTITEDEIKLYEKYGGSYEDL